MFVFPCVLFVDYCCSLHVACRFLFVFYCLLFVGCWLLVFRCYCSLFRSWFCSLLVVRCLFMLRLLLIVAYCVAVSGLLIACLLFVAC